MKKLLQSLSFTLFIFGFAGWVYIVLNSEIHMETLSMPLTHFLSWPREDTFGAACFGVAFISLFIYRLIQDK